MANSPAIVYPSGIKANKEKLHVLFSVNEQMQVRRNQEWQRAKDNPDEYIKSGKWRKYVRNYQKLIQPFHLEQLNLQEIIRAKHISLAERKQLDVAQAKDFYHTYFGNAQELGVDSIPRGVVVPILDIFKVTDLSKFLVGEVPPDPLEDWTPPNYTTVDTNSRLTVAANHITATGLVRGDDSIVYKTGKSFGATFLHYFEAIVDSATNTNDYYFPWAITDTITPSYGYDPILLVAAAYDGANVDWLIRVNDGVVEGFGFFTNKPVGNYYYIKVDKNVIDTDIFWFDDFIDGNQVGTASVANGATTYDVIDNSWPRDGVGAGGLTGDVYNQDLNEAGAALTKSLSDTVAIADSIVKAPSLVKADSISIADSISKEAQLAKADTIALAESLIKDVGLFKTDSVTIVESLSKLMGIFEADNVALADALIKTVGLVEADSIAIVDSVVKSIEIVKIENIAVIDAIAKDVGISLTDLVAVMDAIAKEVDISFADTVVISDIYFISKSLAIKRLVVSRMGKARLNVSRMDLNRLPHGRLS